MSSIVPFNICNPGNEFVTASTGKPNNVRISRFSEEAAWWTHAQVIFTAFKEVNEKRRKRGSHSEEDMPCFRLLLQAFKKHGHGINNQLAVQFEKHSRNTDGFPSAYNKVLREKAITAFVQSIFPKLPREQNEYETRVVTKLHSLGEVDHKAAAYYNESWSAYDARAKALKTEIDLVIPPAGHAINDNIVSYSINFQELLPVYSLYQTFINGFLPCQLEDVTPRITAFKASDTIQTSVVLANEDLILRINGAVQQLFVMSLSQYFLHGATGEPTGEEFLQTALPPNASSGEFQKDITKMLYKMLLTEQDYEGFWDTLVEFYDYREPMSEEEKMKKKLEADVAFLKRLNDDPQLGLQFQYMDAPDVDNQDDEDNVANTAANTAQIEEVDDTQESDDEKANKSPKNNDASKDCVVQ